MRKRRFATLWASGILFARLALASQGVACDALLREVPAGTSPLLAISATLQATEKETGRKFGHWSVESVSQKNSDWAFAMIRKSYSKIGAPVNDPAELNRYTYLLAFRASDDAPPSAVATVWENAHGEKLGLIADDTTPIGRAASTALRRNYSRFPGVYIETSKVPAHIALSVPDARVVPFEKAREVMFPMPIRRPTPEELKEAIETHEIPSDPRAIDNAYMRALIVDGEPKVVMKIMLGQPQ